MEDTRKLYGEYQNTLAACNKKSRTVCAVFMFLITLVFAGAAGLCLAAPELVRSLVLLPFPLTAAAGISGVIALAACITAILNLARTAVLERNWTPAPAFSRKYSPVIWAIPVSPRML